MNTHTHKNPPREAGVDFHDPSATDCVCLDGCWEARMKGRPATEITDYGLGQALARGFIRPTPSGGVEFRFDALPESTPTPEGSSWAAEAIRLWEQWLRERQEDSRHWFDHQTGNLASTPTLRAAIQAACQAGIRTAAQAERFFGGGHSSNRYKATIPQRWVTNAAIAAMVEDGYTNTEIRASLAEHGIVQSSAQVRTRRHQTVHRGPFGQAPQEVPS